MQTQAQRRFDSDYRILRRLFLTGKSKKDAVRNWIKIKGEEVAEAAEQEIQLSPRIVNKLKKQSGYEIDLMDEIHEKDGYDKEEE